MVICRGVSGLVAGIGVVDICTVSDMDTQAGGAATADDVLNGRALAG